MNMGKWLWDRYGSAEGQKQFMLVRGVETKPIILF
jgi:hypothetical protein